MSFKDKYLKYKNKYLILKISQNGGAAGGRGPVHASGANTMDSILLWTEIESNSLFHNPPTTPVLDKNSQILSPGDTVLLPNIEKCKYSIGELKETYRGGYCRVQTADGKNYSGPCTDLKIYKKKLIPIAPVSPSNFILRNADYNYGNPDPLAIKSKDKDSKEISIGSNVLIPFNTLGAEYRWGKLHGTRNNGAICIVRTQDGKFFWGPCSELQS